MLVGHFSGWSSNKIAAGERSKTTMGRDMPEFDIETITMPVLRPQIDLESSLEKCCLLDGRENIKRTLPKRAAAAIPQQSPLL